jgi:hypothetical protein
MYKVFEERQDGADFLFHGVAGSKRLTLGEWIEVEVTVEQVRKKPTSFPVSCAWPQYRTGDVFAGRSPQTTIQMPVKVFYGRPPQALTGGWFACTCMAIVPVRTSISSVRLRVS